MMILSRTIAKTFFMNSRVMVNKPIVPALYQQCFYKLHQEKTNSGTKRFYSLKTVLDSSPKTLQPYLNLVRFDKPIGTYLLFFPCSWSISLAAENGTLPDFKMLLLFGVGSWFMRGAGCIINDLWDHDIDKKVSRTVSRPLAAGVLTERQAITFLSIMLSCSLGILLSFNWYSICLGASSMVFVSTYPLMKRITHWPQVFLGVTFNWGALLGWSAVQGECDWSVCLPLYSACMLWTVFYDTIYAHQDKVDDAMVGVKSTALYFGDDSKKWLTLFSLLIVSSLLITGMNSYQTAPYYGSVGVIALHFIWQVYTVDLSNPQDCLNKFRSNRFIGLFLLSGIVISTLLKSSLNTGAIDTANT